MLPNVTFPRLCFFPVAREPVLRSCDGSTWSVIYSVGLARIQFLLMLGENLLFHIMFAVALVCFLFFVLSFELGLLYIWERFLFCQLRTKVIIYAV